MDTCQLSWISRRRRRRRVRLYHVVHSLHPLENEEHVASHLRLAPTAAGRALRARDDLEAVVAR
jgi:hypothetical protein